MAVKPELTKLAFDNALSHHVDGFEIDVRLTKDQQLVVFMMQMLIVQQMALEK